MSRVLFRTSMVSPIFSSFPKTRVLNPFALLDIGEVGSLNLSSIPTMILSFSSLFLIIEIALNAALRQGFYNLNFESEFFLLPC
jgi:hypothetical protein